MFSSIVWLKNCCPCYIFISYGRASSQACFVRSGSLRYSAIGQPITIDCVTKFTVFGCRFPLDIAFRIYDNCLASGIEAIFGFSIVLLQTNEDVLLTLKFDEILAFMKTRVFEKYKVSVNLSLDYCSTCSSSPCSQIERSDPMNLENAKGEAYRVDDFVQDAVSLKITPFMLDSYAREYEDLIRIRDAHALEVETLRQSNRNFLAQVWVIKITFFCQLDTTIRNQENSRR